MKKKTFQWLFCGYLISLLFVSSALSVCAQAHLTISIVWFSGTHVVISPPMGICHVGDFVDWRFAMSLAGEGYKQGLIDFSAGNDDPWGLGGWSSDIVDLVLGEDVIVHGGSLLGERTTKSGGFGYHVFLWRDSGELEIYEADIKVLNVTSVGGIVVPVDKFALLIPYIGLASTIMVATAATAVYVKRVKRRKGE